MKPGLLFLCHRIPYPPNKGDKIRSFHLLHHLHTHFDVYLGTFVDDKADWAYQPEVEKWCAASRLLPLKSGAARVGAALSGLARGEPLSVALYQHDGMQSWVDTCIASGNVPHLLVYSAAMAQYVRGSESLFRRRVIDFVDVDSDKWRQYAARSALPIRWLYRREARLLLDFERETTGRFDSALFVSSAEAEVFRELVPEYARQVGYYNNGVNDEYFRPDARRPNPYVTGERPMVFTGAMDYWPNIDAVNWFAEDVFPGLRAADPALRFYIVGSNPAKTVLRLAGKPGVVVTGSVADVRPYLQHAALAVAPMRVARGVQNKVLEAMAMEQPVVVTSKGLEGIDAAHGRELLVADDADQFAQQIRQVLAGKHAGMGAAARRLVQAQFNWGRNLPEVLRLLNQEPESFRDTNGASRG